jgi:hypothetical protein
MEEIWKSLFKKLDTSVTCFYHITGYFNDFFNQFESHIGKFAKKVIVKY